MNYELAKIWYESGLFRDERGEWGMENGEWRMENGERRMENCRASFSILLSPFSKRKGKDESLSLFLP
jgi:hypothetical protein